MYVFFLLKFHQTLLDQEMVINWCSLLHIHQGIIIWLQNFVPLSFAYNFYYDNHPAHTHSFRSASLYGNCFFFVGYKIQSFYCLKSISVYIYSVTHRLDVIQTTFVFYPQACITFSTMVLGSLEQFNNLNLHYVGNKYYAHESSTQAFKKLSNSSDVVFYLNSIFFTSVRTVVWLKSTLEHHTICTWWTFSRCKDIAQNDLWAWRLGSTVHTTYRLFGIQICSVMKTLIKWRSNCFWLIWENGDFLLF